MEDGNSESLVRADVKTDGGNEVGLGWATWLGRLGLGLASANEWTGRTDRMIYNIYLPFHFK